MRQAESTSLTCSSDPTKVTLDIENVGRLGFFINNKEETKTMKHKKGVAMCTGVTGLSGPMQCLSVFTTTSNIYI